MSRIRWAIRIGLLGLIAWLALRLVQGSERALIANGAWGWDETMHSELPAVRMLLHAQRGEWGGFFEALHGCDRYPPLYPLLLAVWHGLFGLGETVARSLGLVLFLGGVVPATASLARRVALSGSPALDRSIGTDAALLGALAAIASPLARRYAPTTFIELAALLTIVLALRAWMRRRDNVPSLRADLAAGFWIAAALLTKFNYGALLAGVIVADGLVDLAASRFSVDVARRLARTATPTCLAALWWFALPLPMGTEVAAQHREAFLGFVTGNLEFARMPFWLRATNWLTGVAPHALLLPALAIPGVVNALRNRSAGARTLLIALVFFTVPVILHPFQLDRFLMPVAAVVWTLGAAAVARWTHAHPASLSISAAVLLPAMMLITTFRVTWLFGFPVAPEGTAGRSFQEDHVGRALGLFGPPASNGLDRSTHDGVLDLIAEGVGPEDSVGWLGQSTEISPAALHLGLLERGGSATRFLEHAHLPMDIDPIPGEHHGDRTDEDLLTWASDFDHVVMVGTGDIKDRPLRKWIVSRWHVPLRGAPDRVVRDLGAVVVDRAILGPMVIRLRLSSKDWPR